MQRKNPEKMIDNKLIDDVKKIIQEVETILKKEEENQLKAMLEKLKEKNDNTRTKCYGNKNDYYTLFSDSDKRSPVNEKENPTFTAIGDNKL